MSYFSKILLYLKKFFYSSDDYIIYRLTSRSESAENNPDIKIYKSYKEIPAFILKELDIYPLINPLYHRLKKGQAALICIHSDDEITAYGWLQTWNSFKRKFGWLINKGTMLGPFWTNPDYRGSGYYGHLLNYCITLPDNDYPLVIYTNPGNKSSQRGIDKAGFERIGVFHISFIMRFFRLYRKIG